jgi:hypothetical protein
MNTENTEKVLLRVLGIHLGFHSVPNEPVGVGTARIERATGTHAVRSSSSRDPALAR